MHVFINRRWHMKDPLHYFAYGSNMLTVRLRNRVPSTQAIGRAKLPAYRLGWQKNGRDDSAKCDIIPTNKPDDQVWGVLFSFHHQELPKLDEAEDLGTGYKRISIQVWLQNNSHQAITYKALRIDRSLKPFTWYKKFVVEGAKQHQLPTSYINQLQQVHAKTDWDEERARRNQHILEAADR